jgi:membrane protein
MAREGTAAARAETSPAPHDDRKPDSPSDIDKPGWKYTAKAAFGEFQRDQCTDLAAALTYYSVLSVFPAILALVSLLGFFGQGESTTTALLDIVRQLGQGQVADQLKGPIDQIVNARGAGLALVVGLVGAIWSASGYVGAFGRAMNRVYQVDEGRPIWKLRPVVLLITVGLVIMAALVLVGLVVSGPVATAIGDAVGLGDLAKTIWNIVKWPVMLGIVVVMVAVLYYATPNVRQPKFRWVSIGAAVAILVWVLASIAFGFYVSNFSSYNKTYGSLAGIIVFLLWLWITNLALLFGAELDAELERGRQLQAGLPAEETIQLPPRDTRKSDKAEAKEQDDIERGRRLRATRGEDQ